jgi:hypothetical protein
MRIKMSAELKRSTAVVVAVRILPAALRAPPGPRPSIGCGTARQRVAPWRGGGVFDLGVGPGSSRSPGAPITRISHHAVSESGRIVTEGL